MNSPNKGKSNIAPATTESQGDFRRKRLNIGENRKLDIDRQGYYFKLNMEDFKNDPSEDMVSMCGHA
jgi:hypothetical protein